MYVCVVLLKVVEMYKCCHNIILMHILLPAYVYGVLNHWYCATGKHCI